MTPDRLRSWQPDADEHQLAEFIEQNHTLLLLLEETWQKFQPRSDNTFRLPENTPFPTKAEYAAGYTIDELQHFALSPEENAAFSAHFERNDRPFGNKPVITDYDWDIIE